MTKKYYPISGFFFRGQSTIGTKSKTYVYIFENGIVHIKRLTLLKRKAKGWKTECKKFGTILVSQEYGLKYSTLGNIFNETTKRLIQLEVDLKNII